jgi:type II secretory pathway pseudopilin PulG
MNIKIKKNNMKKAFTLIEALVAISILMIAIASPMTLAQKGLSTATQSKDQMIAAFLAQDAIEAVKNIRDQIAISQTTGNWLTNTLLNDCICEGAECNFDDPLNLKFCTIDTTSPDWANGEDGSIQPGNNNDLQKNILKVSYTAPDTNGVKHFLKYDYKGTIGGAISNEPDTASKFSRYINIKKTSEVGDGANEAVVHVRVFWGSTLGPQQIDIQDFIYNYSENL